jgi:hypothetical protein
MFLWEVNGFRMEQKSKGDLFFFSLDRPQLLQSLQPPTFPCRVIGRQGLYLPIKGKKSKRNETEVDIYTVADDGRTEGYGFFNFLFLWADMCENLEFS